MNHAKLSNSLRKGRFDCLPDACKVVCTGYKDVFYSAGFDVGENVKPEGGTLRFTDPHAKNLFPAILFKSDHQVDGFALDLAILPHLNNYAVHPDNIVDMIKGTLLPFLDIFQYRTGNI